jgi:hypothetical protein
MREIKTSIWIDVPASQVWKVFTDFGTYPEWNPFILSLTGVPEKGNPLRVTLKAVGSSSMNFKPLCLTFGPEKEFRWKGRLGFRGLFEGEHIFELSETEGQTLFTQREEFRGILVPLLWKRLNTGTRAGFEAMNQALRNRCMTWQ